MNFGSDTGLMAVFGAYVLFAVLGLVVTFGTFAWAGALILKPVDREGTGIALGLLLGPMGLLIAWVMRSNELLERAEYRERHRAVTDAAKESGKPAWVPDEAPRRFR